MSDDIKSPYRYDFAGSFLRPENLKQARKDFEEGKISREQLTSVEDEEIRKIVAKQKAAGYHIITDGEFRRKFWHLDFMWGFEGIGHREAIAGVQFNDEVAQLEDTYLTGKVKAKAHPFVEYFKFLKQFEDDNTVAKYTISAPAQTFQQMIVPQNFKNTRKYPIMIKTSIGSGVAQISIYGIKEEVEYEVEISSKILSYIPYNVVYETDNSLASGKEKVAQNGMNGCKSITYKILKLNGAQVSSTVLSTDTYDPMNKIIKRGPSKTTETSTVPKEETTKTEPEPTPKKEPEPISEPEPDPEPTPTPSQTEKETNTITNNTAEGI